MPSIRLTDKTVRSLKTNADREDYWDNMLPGLVVRVYGNGRKIYSFIYRTASNRRGRYKIGDASVLSLADARGEARELQRRVGKGEDPSHSRREHKAASTFEELSNNYLELHCRPRLRPRSIYDIEYTLRSILLPAWKNRKVHDITRADIIDLIETIGVKRNAPVRANHVRAVISGIFSFAIQRGIISASPCVGLPRKYREIARSRVLTDEEIVDFWEATKAEAPIMRDLFRVLLLLGQRSGETRQMQWDQIRGDIWEIPEGVTKNKNEHIVPLPKQVLEILNAQKSDNPFVFPSHTGDQIKWLQKANYRILKNIENSKPWRVHDLRRTCATNLEKLGFSDAVIAAVLNHTKIGRLGVTGRYARHGFEAEKRKALQAWADYVASIVGEISASAQVKRVA